MKYLADFVEHFRGRTAFSIRDARVYLKSRGISKAYLHFLIHSLHKRGRLARLAKGVYTFQEDVIVAGFAFQPFYYGLHQALSLHGLWDQATNPVVITSKRVRPGRRTVLGANVIVRRVRPGMLYGLELMEHYGFWIPVSTPEKTLVDFVYFRQKMPAAAWPALAKRMEAKRLAACLKKAPAWVRARVKKMLAPGKRE